MFIGGRYKHKEMRKLSRPLQAQLVTGVTMVIFAFPGQALIDSRAQL